MSDLEAVLADVSYLMAMEKSKNVATKAPKKNMIPDSRYYILVIIYRKVSGVPWSHTLRSWVKFHLRKYFGNVSVCIPWVACYF